MAIQIKIQFNNKILTIPINPEELKIESDAENTDLDIIGIGKVTRKGERSLRKCTIESFFPSANSFFYTGVKPKTCIDFINEIWNAENTKNNVAKITTVGLPDNLNMYFVIENFNPSNKAGEEEDIYYELTIKEYKPYGVRIIQPEVSKVNTYVAPPPRAATVEPPAQTQRTYTVESGDCLWKITKMFTGAGAGWRELYELNTDVIGANPNRIYPGQVLTLPVGW